jgi:ParB family chromosome partitioning protein
MIIDPEFKALIPPLAAEELAQLEANILRDGCRDPLVVWSGTLIDGHNRHAICTKHGLPFDEIEMEFTDRDAVEIWIIENQTGRRNLAAIDKVPLLERKREIVARQAKERQIRKPADSVVENLPQQNPDKTRDTLAAEIGVSGKTYEALRTVSNEGTEELKQAVRDKKVGASTAAAIAHLPAEMQKQIAALHTRKEISEVARAHVHVAQNSGENEWYTPPQFIASARSVMGQIDLDPASSEIANKTVQASVIFTKDDDGLSKQWNGNVWMNPPYAQPLMSQFAEAVSIKYEQGEINQAIVLVNNATETQWFQRMASVASAVCFPKSRVRFLDPQGNPGAPLQGQAILYFGNSPIAFFDEFQKYGATFA